QTHQWTTGSGHGSVQRQHAREALGEGQPQAVGQRGAFAEAGKVDALRVDMVAAPRLLDRPQDVLLDGCIAGSVLTPGEADAAIRTRTDALWPAQADTD